MVTGFCRLFKQMGISVAPFKPQNMALNSAVTVNGGEIGRAQSTQATACGISPHTDMNPVLLKPNNDQGAQIIIHGKAIGNMNARDYHAFKPTAMRSVLDSYRRLCNQYDMIVVEGAGSPAEINLRQNDLANMGFAEAVNCPVLLVADIDRGGVFAHLIGTLDILALSEQDRIKGLLINRFRGDMNLLQSGVDWIEQRSNKPVLGVIPYLQGLHLEAEDRVCRDNAANKNSDTSLQIIAPIYPRISNHTDFDPLRLHPNINLTLVGQGEAIPPADIIILPGSKNVCNDLIWLREQNWDTAILKHLRYGGKLLGLCGGYQMLGHAIFDQYGVETSLGTIQGLGLLEMETELKPEKRTDNVSGHILWNHQKIRGYEIHSGVCTGAALDNPFCIINGRPDGAVSNDRQIVGTFVHGLFELDQEWLFNWTEAKTTEPFNYETLREQAIDTLAASMKTHIDIEQILKLIEQHYGQK